MTESLLSFLRRHTIWSLCNGVLWLVEQRWRDESCRCGWCVDCLGPGPY